MDHREKILEAHGLKKTSPRIEILGVFLKYDTALTHNTLEKELGQEFDRVTIYRTLNAFEEKGLIHKIIAPTGEAKYALCAPGCNERNHQDRHVHFSCRNCHNIYCLNEIEVPELKLPKGFQFSSFSFMAEGLCKNCLSKTGTGLRRKKQL